MRFEKLTENKIRITLSHQDLMEKHIDFHSFMSSSIESQDLFFDMLDEAEKEIGFVTKDYRIRIEALVMSGGDFILTVTRSLPETKKNSIKPKLHIKRKKVDYNSTQLLYSFTGFEDFCLFVDFFKSNDFNINGLSKNIALYEYKNTYYLVFNDINLNYSNLKNLFSSIVEFGTLVNNSDLFISRLNESGKLVIKHNAIKTAMKHFSKN